jgi:hypothetical protein
VEYNWWLDWSYRASAQQPAVFDWPTNVGKMQSLSPKLQEDFLARSLCLVHSALTPCKRAAPFMLWKFFHVCKIGYEYLRLNNGYSNCILHILPPCDVSCWFVTLRISPMCPNSLILVLVNAGIAICNVWTACKIIKWIYWEIMMENKN